MLLTFSDGWQSQCNLVTFASDLDRPDLRGLKQFGEIFNFWVHHWILCFIPLHVIITGHYKLDRTNNYYFKIAAVVGLFVHFNMMSIAGLISGHNVGYMLAPPTSNFFLLCFLIERNTIRREFVVPLVSLCIYGDYGMDLCIHYPSYSHQIWRMVRFERFAQTT